MTKKEKYTKWLEELKAEQGNLRKASVEGDTVEARMTAQEALDKVTERIKELEDEIKELDKPADKPAPTDGEGEGARSGKRIAEWRNGTMENDQKVIEERAKAFAQTNAMKISTKGEARSVLISGGTLATPTGASGINDKFNSVSSIVDMVTIVDANGMGSDKVAYQIADATAATTTEGNVSNASDPTFGFITITPEKETVISYISEEVKAQTPLNYQQKVDMSARSALRAKASAKIIDKMKTSTIVQEYSVTAATIGADMLRKIAFNYGGDENIAGNAVLFLNKADLIAFGDVRGTQDKKAVYEITPDTSNPNTGIIKDGGLAVKYCINSNLTALSSSVRGATAIKTMFYGNPTNFQLDLFSDYEVKVSEDYKFNEGLLAIRGAVQLGGGVVVNNGFVCVVLAAE